MIKMKNNYGFLKHLSKMLCEPYFKTMGPDLVTLNNSEDIGR